MHCLVTGHPLALHESMNSTTLKRHLEYAVGYKASCPKGELLRDFPRRNSMLSSMSQLLFFYRKQFHASPGTTNKAWYRLNAVHTFVMGQLLRY